MTSSLQMDRKSKDKPAPAQGAHVVWDDRLHEFFETGHAFYVQREDGFEKRDGAPIPNWLLAEVSEVATLENLTVRKKPPYCIFRTLAHSEMSTQSASEH